MRKIRIIGSAMAAEEGVRMVTSEVHDSFMEFAWPVVDDAFSLAIANAGIGTEDPTCLILSASLRGVEYPYSSRLLQVYARSRAIDDARCGTAFIEDLRTASSIIESGRHRSVMLVSVEFSNGIDPDAAGFLPEWDFGATAFVIRQSDETQNSAILRIDTKQIRLPATKALNRKVAEGEGPQDRDQSSTKRERKERRKTNIPMRVRWVQQSFFLKNVSEELYRPPLPEKDGNAGKKLSEEGGGGEFNQERVQPLAEPMRHLLPFSIRLIEDAGMVPDRIGIVVWNRLEVLDFNELVQELRNDPLKYANQSTQMPVGSSLAANLHQAIKDGLVRRGENMILLEVQQREIAGSVMVF